MGGDSGAVPTDLTDYRSAVAEASSRLTRVAAAAQTVLDRLGSEPGQAPLARRAAGVHSGVLDHAARSRTVAGWVGQVGDAFRQADAGAPRGRLSSDQLPKPPLAAMAAVRKRPHVAIRADFPDPSILKVGHLYYAYATGSGGRVLQVSTAHSPNGPWSKPKSLRGFRLPSWAYPHQGAWAPDVHRLRNGTYILYFSAKKKGGREAIGYATSTSPRGPWRVSRRADRKPLIYDPRLAGDIDPSLFTDRNGRNYVVYKNDGNAVGKVDTLWIQRVGADGHTRIGRPIPTLNNRHRLVRGSRITIEAPQIVRHGKEYVMFYSTGSYNDAGVAKYSEHYATARSLHGPWTPGARPLLQSGGDGGRLQGPGGATVEGSTIVFHNIASVQPLVRQMWVARLRWRWQGAGSHRVQVPYVTGGTPA